MATITPSTEPQADLRLANKDPEVTHSGSGDRFTVKFTMEGVALLELQNVLEPRLAAVGVERISRFGMTISLHGVEAGREGEVFPELETAIEDVNRLRESARGERERSRAAAEAADALAEGRLETSGTASTRLGNRASTPTQRVRRTVRLGRQSREPRSHRGR